MLRGSVCSVLGMEPKHRALLREHRLKLSEELLVTESIVQFLYQEEILSQHQVEEIESQPSNRQKSLKLLDILPSRGPRAFSCFLQALDDFSWVRDGLLLELQKGAARGHGATGVCTPSLVTSGYFFCSLISVMEMLENPELPSYSPLTFSYFDVMGLVLF